MNNNHQQYRIGAGCCFILTCVAWAFAETPVGRSDGLRSPRQTITAPDVRTHIEYLADPKLNGRSGAGAVRAANYIRRRFHESGLKPLFTGAEFLQEIPGVSQNGQPPSIMGRNIGGWIAGSDPQLKDEYILITAHYDHLGVRNGQIYAGADDNASGVSMLLEVSRRIAQAKAKPRRSLVFVAFDLEERMLWGSRWFAAHPPWPLEQVKLFITADMIGRSLADLPLPTVFVMGSEHAPQLQSALDSIEVPEGLEVARLGIDLIGSIPRSDYGPFQAKQIPFLFFSTGEHPDYHTPRDTADRIDSEKTARISNLILRVGTHVANADEAPVWTDDLKPNLNEARALNRIASLLLEAEGGHRLTDVQRFVVSHAQSKTRQIVDKGEMTTAERNWLIRIAQVLMLSVF